MENKNQKTMIILIGVFLFIFVVSVVYAAAAGVLTLSGTANFSEIIRLEFTDASIDNPEILESATPSSDGQTLNVVLYFSEVEEVKTIYFKLKNTGNVSVDTDEMVIPSINGLIFDYDTGVDYLTVAASGTSPSSGYHWVTVEWDDAYPAMIGAVPFTLTLDYDETPPGP